MIVIKDILAHYKVYSLSIISLCLSIILILTMTIVSDNIFNTLNEQYQKLGVYNTVVEVLNANNLKVPIDFIKEKLLCCVIYLKSYDEYTLIGCSKPRDFLDVDLFKGELYGSLVDYNNDNVAVIGYKIYEKLQYKDSINLNGALFNIVAVLSDDSYNLCFDYDNYIFVAEKYIPSDSKISIITKEKISNILLEDLLGVDNYYVINQSSSKKSMSVLENTIKLSLYALGYLCFFISLLSMLNNMLNNIKERKKEIGIKYILGANEKDIRKYFLFEIVGIQFASLFISLIALYLMITLLKIQRIPYLKCLKQLLLVLVSSFYLQMYPLKQASKLKIIDCVR